MTWIILLNFILNIIIASYVAYRLASLFKTKLIMLLPFTIILLFVLTRLAGITQYQWLTKTAQYGFALLICAILVTITYDVFLLINRYAKLSVSLKLKRLVYLLSVIGLFSWGVYAASIPVTTNYTIHINKSANIEKMRVVQISDIHINELTNPDDIRKLVERVNNYSPDLVVLTGDTLDRNLQPFIDLNLAPIFRDIKSTYGNVLVLGNHEYYGLRWNSDTTMSDIINAFEQSNLIVLRDSSMEIADTGIMLIGRDDRASEMLGMERKPWAELISNIDTKRVPVILLKHQPRNLSDISEQGVDVMFSGHTHGGQIFPATLAVKYIYLNEYGLYQHSRNNNHDFSSIVSSGYGLWGPPIRILTQSEIVVTDLTFNKQEPTASH